MGLKSATYTDTESISRMTDLIRTAYTLPADFKLLLSQFSLPLELGEPRLLGRNFISALLHPSSKRPIHARDKKGHVFTAGRGSRVSARAGASAD